MKTIIKTQIQKQAPTKSSKPLKILLLVSAIVVTAMSGSATADENKKQNRFKQKVSREISKTVDHQSHRKHLTRNRSSQERGSRAGKSDNVSQRAPRERNKNRAKVSTRKGDNKNNAVTRFKAAQHADQIPNSSRLKTKVNRQEQKIQKLQQKTKRQQKQIHRVRKFAANQVHSNRTNTNRVHKKAQSFHRNYPTKNRVKRSLAKQRRFLNAQYRKPGYRTNHRGRSYNPHATYRTFGRSFYPSVGLIYSYHLGTGANSRNNRGFAWDRVESFYSPDKRNDFAGEELVIEVDERVRTIQLEGTKRRMFIEAAYVEFGNGEVRQIPEFEGTLHDNDVINLHFQDSRYVVAVYLDVAANDGRNGRARLNVLKARR